jgi:prepilin-type N-terminal cleavage/methylation domain-containing protein
MLFNPIRRAREHEGFTLIELLIVIVVIGILASIGIPMYLNQAVKADKGKAKANVAAFSGAIISGASTSTLSSAPIDLNTETGRIAYDGTAATFSDGATVFPAGSTLFTNSLSQVIPSGTIAYFKTTALGEVLNWCVSAPDGHGGSFSITSETGSIALNATNIECASSTSTSVIAGGGGLTLSGWTAMEPVADQSSVASSANGTKLAFSVLGGQIHTSTDSGGTWTAVGPTQNWYGIASSSDGNKLVAVSYNGQIYTSTDSGSTWTARDSNRAWDAVASSSDGSKLVALEDSGGIYVSSDSGATWNLGGSVPTLGWDAVASSSDGSKLVAVATGGNIYTSTDSGATWTARDSVRDWQGVASSSDGVKLAATDQTDGQIYLSTDSGITWSASAGAPVLSWYPIASSADGTKLIAGAAGNQLYTSTDSGITWSASGSSQSWSGLASSSSGNKLAAIAQADQLYTAFYS